MIIKILSANDVGKTKSHQAGILIPKNKSILSFFPTLSKSEKNPRVTITFTDDSGQKWAFNFIYYNNKFFGGTRNEYRLTSMTKFFKVKNLKEGDKLFFSKNNEKYVISHKRESNTYTKDFIKLSDSWITVNLR